MKKLIFIATIFLSTLNSFSQTPNWAWAKNKGNSYAYAVTTDVFGNVYLVGITSGGISFGTDTIPNPGMLIVKYNASGNVIWAKEESNWVYAKCVVTDALGNVYVAGTFSGTSTSSTVIIGSDTLTNAGGATYTQDIFVAKYDSNGNEIWAKSAGNIGNDWATSISIDGFGNLYVSGGYTSATLTIGSTTLTNAGSYDFFIAKYNNLGNAIWAKSGGSNSDDYSTSVISDAIGNVYMTGYFMSPNITFGSTTLNNAGNFDMFIVKYDNNGNVLWASRAGSTNEERGNAVSLDAAGNVYLGGWFYSPAITIGTTLLNNTSTLSNDLFLIKYDSNGNVIWAKSAGGNQFDELTSIVTNANGNTFITGGYSSPSLLFSGSDTLINNSSTGNWDVFIAKYDVNGNVVWAKSIGGISIEVACSITVDTLEDIYTVGYFQSPSVVFDSTTLIKSGLSSNDMYFAKIGSLPVEISETSDQFKISIYPNPFTSQTTISFSEQQINTTIKITDILGQVITTIHFTGRQLVIDKAEMKAGIYFVQTTDEKKNVTNKKIIIQ